MPVLHRRFISVVLPLVTFFVLVGFGWEDIVDGPYHHNLISQHALDSAGFSSGAAGAVAWHSYKIDDYGYSPIWWAEDWDRFEASLATKGELARLHFDDLYSTDRVEYAYRRYLTGTIAGLIWAAKQGDVGAAHNLLGVSLHAIQDFYSHSNWIDDPARRKHTFFEMPAADRRQTNLFTGAYEGNDSMAPMHHGEIAPACSYLTAGGVDYVMEFYCPFTDSDLCRQWRACGEAESLGMSVTGVEIEGAVYMSPAGMALDNTWMSAIAGVERGLLTDRGEWPGGGEPRREGENLPSPAECERLALRECENGSHYLFAAAKKLAEDASYQWLQIAEAAMKEAGEGAFWERVKNENTAAQQTNQFEQYHRFPYQFLSAGYYLEHGSTEECLYGDGVFSGDDTCASRNAPVPDDAEQYFLRVDLKTSNTGNAGTDADIILKANGREFLLDYSPRVPEPHGYNDFEQGDHQVYTVGPFSEMPEEITLVNRSSGAGDVIEQMWTDFKESVDDAWEWTAGALTNEADFVAEDKVTLRPDDLLALSQDRRTIYLDADGGSEGHFQVLVNVMGTGVEGGSGLDAWREYEVKPIRLHAEEESDIDGLSGSDEPFVLFMLAEHGSVGSDRIQARGRIYGPFSDVDTGETVGFSTGDGYPSFTTRIRNTFGMLTLAAQVWEHDDEDAADREAKLAAMIGELDEKRVMPEENWLDKLAASVAEDWKLEHIEVTAFRRNGNVAVGEVESLRVNEWIDGGEERSFRLGDPEEYDISMDDLLHWPTPLNPYFQVAEDHIIADAQIISQEPVEEEGTTEKRPRRSRDRADNEEPASQEITRMPEMGSSLTVGYLNTDFSYSESSATPYDFSGAAPALRFGWQSGALTLSYNRRQAQSLEEGSNRSGLRSFAADLQTGGNAYLVRQPLAIYVPIRLDGSYRYVSPLTGEADAELPPALHLAGAGLGAGGGIRIAPSFGSDALSDRFVMQATYLFSPGLMGNLGRGPEIASHGSTFEHGPEDFQLRRAIEWDFELQLRRLLSTRMGLTMGYTMKTVSRSGQKLHSLGDVLDLFPGGNSFQEVSNQHIFRVGLSW